MLVDVGVDNIDFLLSKYQNRKLDYLEKGHDVFLFKAFFLSIKLSILEISLQNIGARRELSFIFSVLFEDLTTFSFS